MMNFDEIKDGLLKILNVLVGNKKALTINALSKAANVNNEITLLFLESMDKLKTLEYIKIYKSPSGRFINYGFWKYSKNICFSSHNCVIRQGVVLAGDPKALFYKKDNHFNYCLSIIADIAKSNNVLYIKDYIRHEQIVDEILKINNLKPKEEMPENPLENYPLVNQKYKQLVSERNKLQKQVDDEIQNNKALKEWFEEETKKARCGERTKLVRGQGRFLGYQTIPGSIVSYRDSDWNGGNMITESRPDTQIPRYETTSYSVPDYPDPIEESFEFQNKNTNLIEKINSDIKNLQNYPIMWEKKFTDQKQKALEFKELEKQKKELERKMNSLSSNGDFDFSM